MKQLPEVLTILNIDELQIPKWLKDKIKSLKIERDIAIRNLAEYINKDNEPTNFFIDDWIYVGNTHKQFKKYLDVKKVSCTDGKVTAEMHIDNYNNISIHFDSTANYEAYIKPDASNAIKIVPVKRKDF